MLGLGLKERLFVCPPATVRVLSPDRKWFFFTEISSDRFFFFKTRDIKWLFSVYSTRYRLRPRVLRDVSEIDLTTSLLGQNPIPFPIGIQATAAHQMVHPLGEVATAKCEYS